MSSHAPHGQLPLRVVHVLDPADLPGPTAGCAAAARVRTVAAGLAARGVRVTVCAPAAVARAHGYAAAGARHVLVPDPARGAAHALTELRAACTGVDLVHAHGVHAALRSSVALTGRSTPLVVTWHTPPPGHGARGPLLALLERRAVSRAAVVLGASTALVDRARARGARDARLAPPPTPAVGTDPEEARRWGQKERADLGAVDRPLVVAAGTLAPRQGFSRLLDAARTWRRLDPVPLLVVAGDGPLRGRLQRRIDGEQLPVRLLGGGGELQPLLAAADVAVLTGGAGPGTLLAREALHARVPLVACARDGIPDLVGDAAELVPRSDPEALAAAVTELLSAPGRRRLLADRGRAQTADWPTEDETVAQILGVYDELTQPPRPGLLP